MKVSNEIPGVANEITEVSNKIIGILNEIMEEKRGKEF